MAFAPVTIWNTATHSCVLRRHEGRFELLLYHQGQITRLRTCQTELAALALAHDWRLTVSELGRETSSINEPKR